MHGKETMTTADKNSENNFKRYLADEMTAAERNTFEKELQKDAFEAEALEGFESTSIPFSSDMEDLKEKLKPQKKNRVPIFAAAATILLLITSGIIWLQLNHETQTPQLSENKIEEELSTELKEEETVIEKRATTSQEKAQKPKQAISENEKSTEPQIIETQKSQKEAEPIIIAEVQDAEVIAETEEIQSIVNKKAEDAAVVAFQQMEVEPLPTAPIETDEGTEFIINDNFKQQKITKRTVYGTVISAEDQMPIAGATLLQKGTVNGVVSDMDGNFKIDIENDSNAVLVASFIGMVQKEVQPTKDSNAIIELTADNLALNEVVVVGYGKQRRANYTKQTAQHSNTDIQEAEPVCGMKEYKKQISKNATLPDDFPQNSMIVKLLLTIDKNGTITKIENTNNADKKIVELAKTILSNGPDWNAEVKNGEKIESQVKIKIRFSKN